MSERWIFLTVVAALVLGYGFSMLMMKQFEPAMTAQIAGNQQMADNINRNFNTYHQDIQKAITEDRARIAKLEARK